METIQAIYWDIGGVLGRTFDRTPREKMAERFGMTYETLEKLVWGDERGTMAQTGQISAQAQWEYVCGQLGQPVAALQALRDEFYAGDRLDMELVAAIRNLHRRYRTGIISNAMDDARQLITETWAIGDAFDHLVFSAEAGIMKPDRRIFELALRGLGMQPQQAVFIDDFAHNVTGAQAVGMHAIHFRSPQQALDELHALLDHGTP